MNTQKYSVYTETGLWQASYSTALGARESLSYAKMTARHVKGLVREDNDGKVIADYRRKKKKKK